MSSSQAHGDACRQYNIERFVGLELMKQGALDMQDEERLAQAAAILLEDQAMLESSRQAALGR